MQITDSKTNNSVFISTIIGNELITIATAERKTNEISNQYYTSITLKKIYKDMIKQYIQQLQINGYIRTPKGNYKSISPLNWKLNQKLLILQQFVHKTLM